METAAVPVSGPGDLFDIPLGVGDAAGRDVDRARLGLMGDPVGVGCAHRQVREAVAIHVAGVDHGAAEKRRIVKRVVVVVAQEDEIGVVGLPAEQRIWLMVDVHRTDVEVLTERKWRADHEAVQAIAVVIPTYHGVPEELAADGAVTAHA